MSDLISSHTARLEQKEPNNNHAEQSKTQKPNAFSSGSSSNSDSEDVAEFGNENANTTKDPERLSCITSRDRPSMDPDIKLTRSMSDGQAEKFFPQEFADVFPSLPDSVLNKLGLLGGEVHRERMTEEEIEQKFVTLALAFTIDATTIKDRCQRQRRYRDQTENNLTTEINRLIQKVTCIQPLCIDVHTAELLTGLLAQIDIVIRASYHAAISAERFGAVQHEEKLAEAVNLMISHVSLLKQQRDSVKKQLQYTKKVLQDTNSSEKVSPNKTDIPVNNKFITKRRASIATITQPVENHIKLQGATVTNGDVRRITRRSSDLSTRVSTVVRQTRPSRLDLGADLCKIKENVMDNDLQKSDESDSEVTVDKKPKTNGVILSTVTPTPYEQFFLNVRQTYERVMHNGSLGEFFIFAALLCFVLSIIILGNLLVELELGKRGIRTDVFWKSFS